VLGASDEDVVADYMQFTCFTGTKVQILTQKVLGASDEDVVADYVLSEGIDEIALGVHV
jgi:uncharacterized protein (DUF433 family)